MTKAYIKSQDGVTILMESVHCKNEDKELQLILEKNPDLLPGDQINPDDPRRWFQIAREMPVPDPTTGTDRWSIDFFFADQAAMPTFIECKRFEDTRSRREVVGQMLEYAANGHYYWTKEMLKDYAERLAASHGTSLDAQFQLMRPDDDLDIDSYFDCLENNLREGQVRLVFFMEEAPTELKSVVDFLNKQMERSEVLLVEARQYRHGDATVIVPSLFGYTEEARQVKRTRTITTSGHKPWDYASFFADANSRLDEPSVAALEKLYKACKELECDIMWGTGKTAGSFLVRHPSLGLKTIFVVYSHGRLDLYFGYLAGNERLESIRDALKNSVEEKLGVKVPDDYQARYPTYHKDEWLSKADTFIEIINDLISKYSSVDV